MNKYEILNSAIEVYGEKTQEEVAVEELSELIQAIIRKHRGRVHNIAEEIADVEIMLEQLKIINDCSIQVDGFVAQKLLRLEERLKEQ